MASMEKLADESIRAFAARITGTAVLCGMIVKCSCGLEISYRDKVVLQILLHGMRDNDSRSKVHTRNTSVELIELHKAVDYIEAEEADQNEASNLHGHSNINAIRRSAYQRERAQAQQGKCKNCGGSRHGESNSAADRVSLSSLWQNLFQIQETQPPALRL